MSNQRLRFVFAALMSLWMSLLMTAFVVWLNLGFDAAYLRHWRHAFLAAWPAAFTIVLLFGPTVQRLSQRLASWLPAPVQRG
ncbi:DUF2798 domain-containing protein [Stenotrophomonas sp. NLF4-10]|uniref:DUF2798 domain-containing protein n=1 Tax=Stenotrophomonas sp. NLF4-10 TaxID=2918754 RepID=UPI001EFAB61D|nr:DUF2798 domain-containing protein [Stenotrophomonas sp. NLF4-10]MCG8275471.1 DUF2798 domain-containing protein [Stenotrophomonas sp. NLF4-10]